MMEERINQALLQLENDLQNISSAREQVERTIGASAELQKTVGEYIASVQSLCSELNTGVTSLKERESLLGDDAESAIAEINRVGSSIIESFNSTVDNAKISFEDGTKEILAKYTDENNKLSRHIETLSGLKKQIEDTTNEILSVKESLSKISSDLKESQDAQDEVLNDIKQRVVQFPSSMHEETQPVIQSITGASASFGDALKNTNNRLDDLLTKANQLTSNIDILNTLCQNINSAIISSTTNLSNVITGAKNEIGNNLTAESGKLESCIASIKSLSEGIKSSIDTLSVQTMSAIDTLKENEQIHFESIVSQLNEHEKRLKTEFGVVRKQNKVFSIIIMVLLVIIIGIFVFYK